MLFTNGRFSLRGVDAGRPAGPMTADGQGSGRMPAARGAGAEDYRAAAWCGAPPIAATPDGTDWRLWWWTAVAWAGTGHYARARAALVRGERLAGTDRAARALLSSTIGSIERQLGRHDRGAVADGRALALLGAESAGESITMVAARADALTGLAADLLGRADAAGAERALARVDAVVAAATAAGTAHASPGRVLDTGPVVDGDGLWRARLRRHWVGAETAMVAGRGADALAHAAAAQRLAAAGPSPRHRIKSVLIAAAADAAGGEADRAAAGARQVADRAREHGLWPLRWAATLLLQAVAPDAQVDADRRACERHLAHIGGRFRLLGEVDR